MKWTDAVNQKFCHLDLFFIFLVNAKDLKENILKLDVLNGIIEYDEIRSSHDQNAF